MFIEQFSRFLFLLRAPASSCASVHQSPRAVAFMNSEGRFRRLFHVEQRRIPLRYLLSGFRDKFCSRGSLTHLPPVSYVTSPRPVPLLVSPASSRSCSTSRYSWEESSRCCEQQVSRAPWIVVGGHPPFVPRVTSVPPSLRSTGMLGVSFKQYRRDGGT